MIRLIVITLLIYHVLALKLHNHYDSIDTSPKVHLPKPPVSKTPPATCEQIANQVQKQKDLAANLTDIFRLGKLPGECSFDPNNKQEKEDFIKKALEAKANIVKVKSQLETRDYARKKEMIENLNQYQGCLQKCLRKADGKDKQVESKENIKINTPAVVPVPVVVTNRTTTVQPVDQAVDQQKEPSIKTKEQFIENSKKQSEFKKGRQLVNNQNQLEFQRLKAEQQQSERKLKQKQQQLIQQQQKKSQQQKQMKLLSSKRIQQQKQQQQKQRRQQQRLQQQEKLQQKQIKKKQQQLQDKINLNKQKVKSLEIMRLIHIQRQNKQRSRIRQTKARQERIMNDQLEKEIKQKQEQIKRKQVEKQKQETELNSKIQIQDKKAQKVMKLIQTQKQEQRQEKQKLIEAAAKVENSSSVTTTVAGTSNTTTSTNTTQSTNTTNITPTPPTINTQNQTFKIVQPIAVSMVPLDPGSLRAKKWVTNPLARNVIIDNHTQLLKRYKKILDDDVNNYQTCPIEKPFFDGDQCIACKDYFNKNTLQCVSCPPDTKYDEAARKCIKPIYVTNLNAQNLLIKQRNIQDWKTFQDRLRSTSPTAVVQCPLETPFAVNNQCVNCPDQRPYFDIVTSTCQNCPPKYKYDRTSRKCVIDEEQIQNNYLTNPSSHGLLIDQGNIEQFTNNYNKNKMNTETKYQDCPPDKPFFNGEECIACIGDNNLFSIAMKQCTKCGDGYEYNYQFKSCLGVQK